MAFSGLHVICGFAGGDKHDDTNQPLFKNAVWSEAPASATASTNTAPVTKKNFPVFRITAVADSYVSIGKTPDASASPRYLCLAGVQYDFYVESGDKLAWVAA